MSDPRLTAMIGEWYRAMVGDPERVLKEMPDAQFRLAVLASAELFRTMKAEAERRGIWSDIIEGGLR